MIETSSKPSVIPANQGRRMQVLGMEIILKLSPSENGVDTYMFETLTPPGAFVPPHVHKHEDEILQIVDGEFEIILNGEELRVGSGAVLNFPRFVPHGFRNIGDTPGRTIFTVIPGRNFEKFFEELSALPADQPPDMSRVVEIFERYDIRILGTP